jgi:UDPglucose 6-dehydrogenase/GDP-mannose 6-dehydrogenase
MKVAIIGTGYVGLVSGVCLAEKGHDVTCVDIDADKVVRINRGEAPIHEEGLDELLRRNVGARLRATTELTGAVQASELTMIAVGTPFDGARIDLTYIRTAARQIGEALAGSDEPHVVLVKSTVVPGTTDDVVAPILEEASGRKVGEGLGVGMNPEFLREGKAVEDFMNPDRIVIGATDPQAAARIRRLYQVFESTRILEVNCKTAEMIKYAANSLLATLISFSNEIGNMCAALGDVDVVQVQEGFHLDRRFMPVLENGERMRPGFVSYLEAGCGFGGSCFPKDVKALIARGEEAGSPMRLLEQVIRINADQPMQMVERLERHFPELDGVEVAVLGLAFKPGTDDVRESPALPIVRYLRERGAGVRAFDPVAAHEADRALGDPGIRYVDTLAEAVHGADAIMLITRWDQFDRLAGLINGRENPPLVIDGRRMLDPSAFTRYEGIGL